MRPWPFAALSAALCLAGVALCLGYRHSLPHDAPVPGRQFSLPPGQVAGQAPAPVTLPLQADRLVIPSLGVSAPLGVAAVEDSSLDLPADVDDAVLWDGSAPMSSGSGSLLIAGHLDDAAQEHGALYELSTIRPGAAIYVVHQQVVTSWTVTGLEATPKTTLPPQIWSGPAGPRRLYVITCGGPIVGGHYADNVVVTAAPLGRN